MPPSDTPVGEQVGRKTAAQNVGPDPLRPNPGPLRGASRAGPNYWSTDAGMGSENADEHLVVGHLSPPVSEVVEQGITHVPREGKRHA